MLILISKVLFSFSTKKYVRTIFIADSIEKLRAFRNSESNRYKSFGFVPTMGALHNGHLTLMSEAKKKTEISVASIFVNPSQFSAGEDLEKYPRTLKSDLNLLEQIKIDCVFTPSVNEMYPTSNCQKQLCHVEPTAFNSIYEGKQRPEFFRGVATIVCKLLNIVQPTVSYFGQKDIAQCILIKRMINDLNMQTKIEVIETIRESDGLAMSSRNVYLNNEERSVASVLYRALSIAKDYCIRNMITNREEIVQIITAELKTQPLVSSIDYISVSSHTDMTELSEVTVAHGAVISCALRLGKVRLIDNILIGQAERDLLQG